MYTSLEKLLLLPEDTAIYCGHEYTLVSDAILLYRDENYDPFAYERVILGYLFSLTGKIEIFSLKDLSWNLKFTRRVFSVHKTSWIILLKKLITEITCLPHGQQSSLC